MESQKQPKSIRWAPHLPRTAINHQPYRANAAGSSIVSNNSRAQIRTRGKQDPSENTAPASSSIGSHHSDLPLEELECAGYNPADELPQSTSLSESTPSAPSTAPSIAPSTDTGSIHHASTSSTSLTNSTFQGQDSDGDSCTIETRPEARVTPAIELVEVCQGTFVAVTQEPGHEDKLQWRALSKRIHMAFAKTCRRYPNLSVQFKLAGASTDRLQPVILFVCPPETQKQVRKFLKKQKWLSEAECGYKNMILDGNFLRVALDGEGGLDGGLFIRADMDHVQTLCGKLGRLEGALYKPGEGSRFTIGGVVVVNDTLCCLTTGHVLFDLPDAAGLETSDEEGETDEEEGRLDSANVGYSRSPSRTGSDSEDRKSDKHGVAHSPGPKETRIGRLLTTSNWKRGVLASNEDWSLIRLDAVCSTDEWIVNHFHYPATEGQESLKVTINKLACNEDDMTEAEVVILAGCTGLQRGRLNTAAVQLYLDNATFEAREIVTNEPLGMGDSGSWVVRGSMLLGHVFAVQDKTRWSYMIPITQVIEDIRQSLLTSSIDLPTPANQGGVSLLCPKARRSHASLVTFGANFCPSCKQNLWSLKQNLRSLKHMESSPKDIYVEEQHALTYDDDESYESSSLGDGHKSSNSSDGSIRGAPASTVPTSYYSSTIPTTGSYAPTSRTDGPDNHESFQYVPTSGETISLDTYMRIRNPRKRRGARIPYVALEAVLDEVQPKNKELERLIRRDATIVFDFGNPVNDNVRTTRAVLVTPSLNRALRHVVRWDSRVNQRSSQIVLNEPYAVLVRHLDKLTAYSSEIRDVRMAAKSLHQDPATAPQLASAHPQNHAHHEDIDALIHFTRGFIDRANVASESTRHQRGACVFSKLWMLFYPGITVYARGKDSRGLAAYVVSSVDTDPSTLRPSWQTRMPFGIHMWRLNYVGHQVTREWFFVVIEYFDGEQDINSLNVFPCEYLDKVDGGKIRRELEDRGRRWFRLLRGGAAYYNGELPANRDEHYEGPVSVDRRATDGTLMDQAEARLLPFYYTPGLVRDQWWEEVERERNLERGYSGFPWAGYDFLDPEVVEDLELPNDQTEGKGHRYLLCAPYLPGVLIKVKRWAWVDVNYCSPLKMNPHAWDRLLLPDRTKDLIQRLVQDFRQSTAPGLWNLQRREPSGNLTILLHGSSGTGKRYTAECLAEAEGRVLMTIYPGELGSDSADAKEELSLWFRFAKIFDAIVLVPAAESWVEQIPTGVIGRRDISPVFWANLEMYKGMVILTSSRKIVFDELALSRITLPIHYAPFDSETRQKLGMQLMRRLEEENRSLKITPEARELWKSTLEDVNWNGHEVKTVLGNALAMARNRPRSARGEPAGHTGGSDYDSKYRILEEDDLMAVVESRKQFEGYIKASLHADPSPISS